MEAESIGVWIVQVNLRDYDMFQAALEQVCDYWLTATTAQKKDGTFRKKSNAKHLCVGDKVLFWSSTSPKGFIGRGTVSSEIGEFRIPDKYRKYHIHYEFPEHEVECIEISYDAIFTKRIMAKLSLDQLSSIEVFTNTLFGGSSKKRRGTFFPATQDLWEYVIDIER